jgi:hypothetical protein
VSAGYRGTTGDALDDFKRKAVTFDEFHRSGDYRTGSKG